MSANQCQQFKRIWRQHVWAATRFALGKNISTDSAPARPCEARASSEDTGRAAEAPSWSRGPARPPWAPTSGKWLYTSIPVSPTCPTDLHSIYEMPLEFLHSECLLCWKKYIKISVKEDFLKQTEFSFLCENLNSVSHKMWLTFFYNQNLFATVPRSKKVNTLTCSDVTQLPELNRFAI